MTRRTRCLVLGGCLVLLAAPAVWLVVASRRTLEDRAARIRPGMTEAEVTAVLGPPTKPREEWRDTDGQQGYYLVWEEGRIGEDGAAVFVQLRDDGRVMDLAVLSEYRPPTILDRIRGLLP